jgi:hypothetical protein
VTAVVFSMARAPLRTNCLQAARWWGAGTNISAFGITPPPTGYNGTQFQNATGNNIGIDSSIPSPAGP